MKRYFMFLMEKYIIDNFFQKPIDKSQKLCYNISTVKEMKKMTVAELIERLSKQNPDYVVYRDYGNGFEKVSWDDFWEMFWIWDKSEVEEDD